LAKNDDIKALEVAMELGDIKPTGEDMYDLGVSIDQAWRDMHHNASIRSYYPDFQNDYETDLFWSRLEDEAHWFMEDLMQQVEEKFGWALKFYQYGRQGATIAPNDWMLSASCNNFGEFNGKPMETSWDEDDPDTIEHAYEWNKRVLDTMIYINERCEEQAKYVPEWWEDTKEANGYKKEIDAHDGKKKVMREVWVDEDE